MVSPKLRYHSAFNLTTRSTINLLHCVCAATDEEDFETKKKKKNKNQENSHFTIAFIHTTFHFSKNKQ